MNRPTITANYCDHCGEVIQGEDSTPPMAWDLPTPPKYVRTAALSIMRGLNTTTTQGTEQ
jgi:uncharacterized protein involved in propanediol utilization